MSGTGPVNAGPGAAGAARSDTRNEEPAALPGPRQDTAARPARVYEYWLGGSDHREADRVVAGEVLRHYPGVVADSRANREYGRRVIWYASSALMIGQFLDIGAGLLGRDATHETARRVRPGCRVLYADCDPLVADIGRGQFISGSGCAGDYICADVRDPAALLAEAGKSLDFTEPVAVLLLSILHFVPAAGDPAGIVAELTAALAPGSLIAISHLTADFVPGPVEAAAAAYNALMPAPVFPRGVAEITGLLSGVPPQYPGVVPVTMWRPSFQASPERPVSMYGAVALPHPRGTPLTY